MGGYTPPFQETPTTIESELGNRYENQFCTHWGESSTVLVVEDEDKDCSGKILTIEMSTKKGLSKATLTGVLMTMKLLPFLMLMIWLNVIKMMQTLLLEFNMFQMWPPFMNLLPNHFMQILWKICLNPKLFNKNLVLLGMRIWILRKGWFLRIKRRWNMH